MKNLYIYQCAQPLATDYLDTDLERMKFIPPMPQSMESSGWQPTAASYFQAAGPYTVMQFRYDKKILPKSAIDDAMLTRAENLADLTFAEKKQLKDDVMMTLKPQALCRRTDIPVIWHQPQQQIWVGTSSATRADAVMDWVLQTWPGLQVARWLEPNALRAALTQALREDKWPQDITTGDKVVLIHPQEQKRKITVTGVDASYEGILSWLNQGFVVQQIRLVYNGEVEMVFSDQGFWSGIKDLKVNDALDQDENDPNVRLWHQCGLIDSLIRIWHPWLQEVEVCQETTVS